MLDTFFSSLEFTTTTYCGVKVNRFHLGHFTCHTMIFVSMNDSRLQDKSKSNQQWLPGLRLESATSDSPTDSPNINNIWNKANYSENRINAHTFIWHWSDIILNVVIYKKDFCIDATHDLSS